uniref:protein FAM110C-like n=1 Tax=Myxine glutinosa TaxID=7769 RepID=UPI0035900D73
MLNVPGLEGRKQSLPLHLSSQTLPSNFSSSNLNKIPKNWHWQATRSEGRPSARERLDADRPKYIRSQAVVNADPNPTGSCSTTASGHHKNESSHDSQNNNVESYDGDSGSLDVHNDLKHNLRSSLHYRVATRKSSRRGQFRPDSLIIHRRRQEETTNQDKYDDDEQCPELEIIERGSSSNFFRRLGSSMKERMHINTDTDDHVDNRSKLKQESALKMAPDTPTTADETPSSKSACPANKMKKTPSRQRQETLKDNEDSTSPSAFKIKAATLPPLSPRCTSSLSEIPELERSPRSLHLPRTLPTVQEDGSPKRRLPRYSRSDITSRISRSAAEIERFFNLRGLDQEAQEAFSSTECTRDSSELGSVRLRSASIREKHSSVGEMSDGNSSGGEGKSQPQTVSVVERNARIIKWIYNCREKNKKK